jgi:COX assembly protein 1
VQILRKPRNLISVIVGKKISMIITTLNAEEEEVVLQRFKKEARDNCKEQMQRLVACTKTKTFSLMWECKEENKELHNCLAPFTTTALHLMQRHLEIDRKKEFMKSKGKYPPFDTVPDDS